MSRSLRPRRAPAIAVAVVSALQLVPCAFAAEPAPPEQVDMRAMMERARQFTQPGEHHRLLERFLGEWTTEVRFTMPGGPGDVGKGTASGRWLMDGRWLVLESNGTMMGMPTQTFLLLGYDNFKMSYVSSHASSFDTALTHAEGDVDPKTGALVSYGTLDEYLTGEHDKMVKYVWRFPDADTLRLEVHDLPIGEANTQVVDYTFRRKKG